MERREFLKMLGGGPSSFGGAEVLTVVEARDPDAFRAAFIAAVGKGGQVALANPDWGPLERAEFERVIARAGQSASADRGWLLIPTGGSTGGVKLARHDQATVMAAVRGYAEFFAEVQINTVGVLPLHHVGGLMGWLRSVLTDGRYVDGSWPNWREGRFNERVPEDAAVSLVPAQLRRLLHDENGVRWLRRFRRVLIGGASIDRKLVEQAVEAEVPIVPSYGMTETAAMIAARLDVTQDRLEVFPHVEATVGSDDRLELGGASLFRGYWPDWREGGAWLSSDRVERTEEGGLRVLGRADAIIVTGGEKVDAGEVELMLRELLRDDRVAVLGVPDERWGQRVVAAVAADLMSRTEEAAEALRGLLAPFKQPKAFVPIREWPINALGKVQRGAIQAQLEIR